jgi:hypothetical protein
MKHQGANDVGGGANHTLDLAVLREGKDTTSATTCCVRERRYEMWSYQTLARCCTKHPGWCNRTEIDWYLRRRGKVHR